MARFFYSDKLVFDKNMKDVILCLMVRKIVKKWRVFMKILWLFKNIIFLNIIFFVLTGCSFSNKILDPKDPISIEIWHYYNGPQKIAFDEMVMEFNETIGFEKGIIIEAFSQGNINELELKIMDSVNEEVGAQEIPNIFAAYADTAYMVDKLGLVVELDKYFTEDELGEYVDSYIEEGRIDSNNKLKIFPIIKATEIMMLNKTDWDKFSGATGATTEELSTWEGLARVAEEYYNWSNGKTFFGRDAMANYFIIGSKQLGKDIFEVNNGQVSFQINNDIMRKLWDNFYLPYISGYYGAYGKFRSDDAKTGDLIALVGSTTGAAYFPEIVTTQDNISYEIEPLILPLPNFENTKPYAVQQGAGMVVLKSDEKREYACAEFLKWFTEVDRNIDFSIASGYMPVKKPANDIALIEEKIKENEKRVSSQLQLSLPIAIDQINKYELYTNKPFENGTVARSILNNALLDKAKADRLEVVKLIKSGIPHEEAIKQIATEKNFEQWLLQLKTNFINLKNK